MKRLPLILRLDKAGMPIEWLTACQAASLIVREQVTWKLGNNIAKLRGGYNRFGQQSSLLIPAIIATRGDVYFKSFTPVLHNSVLFRRDHHRCLYCGEKFSAEQLTRDHVVPRSLGGKETWLNIVTACRRCNHRKGARTPEEANMPLLATPYVPNKFEFMILANRRILADQMNFLQSGCSRNC